jgi:hypothetical protein
MIFKFGDLQPFGEKNAAQSTAHDKNNLIAWNGDILAESVLG